MCISGGGLTGNSEVILSGFGGIFCRDGAPVQPDCLLRLAEGIACRGADGEGSWHQGPIGLAHAHFWTTPEEVGERQPVHRPGRDLWLCGDLRLDNREELLATLGDAVEERPVTDAQIVLAAYDRWEEDCPRHLAGDFAFVLWDGRRRRLFAARDPFGVRPFFYTADHRRLIAASTLEAVLASLGGSPGHNEPFLRDLLAWRFDRWIAETPYRGILRLPPAHRMMIDAGSMVVSRYWVPGEASPPPLRRPDDEIERFRETFLAAVKACTRSRGPVAVLLSGGLDSSAVACAAEHLTASGDLPWNLGLRLYSCVFTETPGAQEREYAEAVARRCRHAAAIFLPSDDCWSLREFGADENYPLAEPEIGLTRLLMLRPMRTARADGCRVVVSGMAGDQALGGEPYHRPPLLRDVEWSRLLSELPHFRRWSRKTTAGLLLDAYVRPAVPSWLRRVVNRVRRRGVSPAFAPPGPPLASRSAEVSRGQLTAPSFAARLAGLSTMARAAGVEHRTPFLDRRLFETLLVLPPALRFRDGWIKRILRLALADLLPEEIRSRTRFAYFSELETRGLRQRERPRIEELLTGSRAVSAGYLAADRLYGRWAQYWQGERLAPRDLAAFLCLEAWLREQERCDSVRRLTPVRHRATLG